jgi:hypothetical protein
MHAEEEAGVRTGDAMHAKQAAVGRSWTNMHAGIHEHTLDNQKLCTMLYA